MKNCKSWFTLLSAFFAFSIPPQMASAELVITEVMSNSAHPGGGANGDWWELTNFGPTAIQLENFYWDDDGPSGNDGALFPNFSLASGASVVILDENAGDAFVAAWGGGFDALNASMFAGPDDFSGLSASGDQIALWDADPNSNPTANLVAFANFGDSTDGFSFEWDSAGNSLGLSAVGKNGAFLAINDGADPAGTGLDVGSPGFAVTSVPEPSSFAILALSGLACLRRRRRV